MHQFIKTLYLVLIVFLIKDLIFFYSPPRVCGVSSVQISTQEVFSALQMGQFFENSEDASVYAGSLDHNVDVVLPTSKRSRVNGPSIVKKAAASIEVLPDECLFEVLRRLPRGEERSICAFVSKRWLMLLSTIGKDEINATKVAKSSEKEEKSNISEAKKNESVGAIDGFESEDQEAGDEGYLSRRIAGKNATDVTLASIAVGIGRHGGLGKLTIRGSKSPRGVTNLGLRSIGRCCPSLKDLSLWDMSYVGDEGLYEIASGCHLLEKLDLGRCTQISDKGLLAIAKSCPQLTSLTIEDCPKIGDGCWQALGSCCPKLKSVSIKNCPLVGDPGIGGLLSSASGSLSKLELQTLGVSDLSLAVIGLYGKAITDLSFIDLQNVGERGFWVMGNGHGLQKLRSLTVISCSGVTDIGLQAVGKGCSNLKQLSLQKCELLSDTGLVLFAKAVDSLEYLQLEDCPCVTQFGFFGLLLNCGKSLKALTLVNCLVKNVAIQFPPMEFSTSLESICIRNCPGFGDAILAHLSKMCPQLEYLDFNGLHGISDDGLLPLIRNSDVGISKVSLNGCVNLTDIVVEVIVDLHGLTLEQLNLDGCKFVTDASLVAVTNNCYALKELDVSKCGITDYGIAYLACSQYLDLQTFSLSGCCLVTTMSFSSLMVLGRTLVALDIQQCKAISTNTVGSLVEHLYGCEILY